MAADDKGSLGALDCAQLSAQIWEAVPDDAKAAVIYKAWSRDGQRTTLATLCSGTDAPARAMDYNRQLLNTLLPSGATTARGHDHGPRPRPRPRRKATATDMAHTQRLRRKATATATAWPTAHGDGHGARPRPAHYGHSHPFSEAEGRKPIQPIWRPRADSTGWLGGGASGE